MKKLTLTIAICCGLLSVQSIAESIIFESIPDSKCSIGPAV